MNKSLLILLTVAAAFLNTAIGGPVVRKPLAGVEEQNIARGNAPSMDVIIPNRVASILGVPVPYATITAAIAAATPGDTIEVAAGTFIENVIVNKSVHIRGAGSASTFIKPSFIGANPGGSGSLPVGHSTLFLIEASNVTIEKMTIDGDNTSLASGIGKGGADIDARNGIITNHTLGIYNGLTVRNVTVKNIYLRGIYASSGGTFTLTDNRVHNVQADSIDGASIGIFNFGGAGTIQRDTVSDCSDAIAANHSKGTQFLDNVVTGSGSGVHSDNTGDAGGVADLIQGNNVSNSTLYGYGIWVFVPYIAPTLNNNSVTNVDVGMGSFAGAFGPTVTPVFTNNTIDGQNKPLSTGFYITNTTWYYGLTNVSTTFTNNLIKNNVDGVYIESGSGFTVTFNATSNAIQSNTSTGVVTAAVPAIYGNPSGLPGTLVVNLTSNWWGNSTGPLNATTNPSGTGNSIDNALDYSPWWGADYRGAAHPWNWYVNTSNSSTIQEGIGLATAGDVINATAATYAERVTINKSLTLQGAGELTTILNGTGLVGSGSGITINNAITNVSIKDLTVKNYAGTSPNSYAGIYAVAGNNNLTVLNVTLKDNVGGSGFYANGPVNGITLNNLDVSGHPNTFGAARGIVIWNGLKENISITNCDVYNNNCCGIELQDGTASGVTLQNNNIHDNSDNGIGTVGLQGPGENLIRKNTITNNGRFGIEVKNPNGSGIATGPGRVVVDSNTVTRTVAIVDARDIVGIAAFRRGVLAGNVDVPLGAVIANNTVSGYVQSSTSDGFGIVVEGMTHSVSGNTVSGCDVGIQRQYGHTPYPGDGDQSNLADTYFGRGNSPMSCGINVTGNTLSGNTINTRDVGTGIDAGVVTNTNTTENFCTIQSAINDPQTLGGHTIQAGAGVFAEDVNITKALTVKGQGIDVTTIIGPKTGPNSATVRISTTGIVVEGFTITRDGNNVTDWPTNVKTAGIAIQGVTASAEIRNNKITGNRTAIDINLSSNNYIHNNIIDFNRSGVILRNQCTNNTVKENDVTNNWTVGILWLNASTEDATGTTFFNNKIEGNWYAQIENRSLTGGVKNFSGNWLGSVALTTANTNGAEPGYAAQIPVLYGGGATPPGGALNVRGVGIADMDYTPWLNNNTDTDVDNGTGIIGFQGSFSTLWVEDDNGQYGPTGRIQEGVDLVSGSTINVMPGTYRGQVYINEPNLNLLSVAGAESTFVLPSLTLMAQPFLPFRSERPIIGVDSLGTNVVIDGFTIDGEGAGNTQAFMSGIQYFKGTGIVRNNTVKRVRATPFDGTQAFIGILVNHDYPRSYAHAVEIHNDSVYDFGKAGIVCNHPGTNGNAHDNVVIGQGPTGLNAQAGIQFGFGSTGTIAGNVVDNISYTTPGTTASSILGFATDGTLSVHDNSINQGQAAINIQQSASYPAWSANANVYANTVTASAAGTGVSSYYGGIMMSAGGPAPARPVVRGASPGKVSPADLENSRGTERSLQSLNAMNVSFAGNVFTSSTPSDGNGLYLLALDTSPMTVTGDSNQFTGYGAGVVTDKDPGATLNTTWRRNKFLGNNYGMYDLTGVLQDAKNNWWNNATGPRDVKSLPATPNYNNTGGLGDSATAFVDYNPWYLDAPMTTLSQYTLSVTTVAHGTVTKSPDQLLYLSGTTVTLAAIPTAGYAFVGWTGDTTTVEDTIAVNMATNKSYVATFTNLLNVTVVGLGTVVKTPDQPTGYAPGAPVGLKATPAIGWHFVSWSVDTTTVADTLNVAFYSDKNYTATFVINQYALNIVIAGSGSVGRTPPGASYAYGTPVTLTATPGGSYSFVGWTGDTVTANNPITITMNSVKNLVATFIGDKFLTVTPESLVASALNGRLLKPARRNKDPYPNWMNLLEETVVQGGFQPTASESDVAGGLRVGVSWLSSLGGGKYRPLRDSAQIHGWVRLTKWRLNVNIGAGYTSIPKSLKDRTGMHTGAARGLDFIPSSGNPQAHVLVGEKLSLPPKRHNNRLFAEMVALKVNIAASQLGKTPVGFGDLIFNQAGNPVSGLTLMQLSAKIDTALTFWLGRATAEYDSFYSAVYNINRAFPGPVDTAAWKAGNKLILNGAIRVGTIPFLQAPPAPPTILPITTDITESDDEFEESEFEDAAGTPIAAKLNQNYPNPFNPGTNIGFKLRGPSLVSLRLYDILGREVGTLLNNEELEEGDQVFEFIATNLATGTYLYRIEATSLDDPALVTVETRKMLLLK